MPLLLLLILVIVFFLKRNPKLNKIFLLATLSHILMLLILYAGYIFKTPNAGNIVVMNDGDIYSFHGGIISFILKGVRLNMEILYERIGFSGYFYNDFLQGEIPPMSYYGIGFNTYLYSIIYAAYGYFPVYIHIFNILINFLTGIIIFKICEILFEQKTATVALILFLFNPVSFYYSTTKVQEPLYIFALYISIYLTILSIQKKNFIYTIPILPIIHLIGIIKKFYFFPILLSISIYFIINILSKKKLLFFIVPVLSMLFIFNLGFFHDKGKQIVMAGASHNQAGFTDKGYGYNLIIFDKDPSQYNLFEQVVYSINAWYHMISEPILSGNISMRLLAYYPYKIVWVVICIFGFLGILNSFRYNNYKTENFFLLLILLSIGSIVALGSGNIGTMLRHRDIITPLITIYSAFFISKVIKWKDATLSFKK